MCHGHPHTHACGHQSVTWHYCPSAFIDLGTGYETPCQNITFAASQPSSARCPLANCDYQSAAGRGWTCCQCGGRNNGGWCSNVWQRYERNPLNQEWERLERCDHGCCRNCVKDASGNPGEGRREGRKGRDSRKHPAGHASGSVATWSSLDYGNREEAVLSSKEDRRPHRRK
ncbi:hypothetical protein VTJ04DRAFT_7735 [Mycothermus thermophilus]|uniref:uncharacterized protein n=1 Tax=Humicola insolens TaxID=85995 RepID=UPI0037428ADD